MLKNNPIGRKQGLTLTGLILVLSLTSMPVTSFGSPEAPPFSAVRTAPPSQTYDLAGAIRTVLRISGTLQIANRIVELDRLRADEVAARGRLRADATAIATRYDQATVRQFEPQSAPLVLSKSHSEILSVSAGQRLDLTGQIRAASDQALLQSLADEFVRDQVRNSLILKVKREYFDLLRAEHRVQVAQSDLDTAHQQQVLTRQFFEAQVGQKIDLLRANTEVSNKEQGLLRAQNQLGLAQAALNRLTGLPILAATHVLEVTEVSTGGAASTVSSVAEPLGSLFSVNAANIRAVDISQEVRAAMIHRPEILSAQVNVRAQEVGVKLAHSGLEPTATVDARGNAYPTTSFQFPRKRTADIRASVTVPLYDGGATNNRVEESHLLTENAQTQLQSRQATVSLEVQQSYLNLRTAVSQIENANAALRLAGAARKLAQVRYSGQVGLFLEVTDAQAALVQAEDAQVNSVYDYLIARAQFENAIGAPKMD